MLTRPEWPHTVDDIQKSLDGIWGLVGATGINGNLMRLEKSLHQPIIYTITEFSGLDENKALDKKEYQANQKQEAVDIFAKALGF